VFVDRADLVHGSILRPDVCVVGAGAAGITVARSLASAGVDVLLLEGGEAEPTERSQSLYTGRMETVHRTREEDGDYLRSSRLRYFGGSTNHWTGACRPFDPLDLEARPWVPHSGWPISHDELAAWYPRACGLVDIPGFEGDHGAARTGERPTVLAGAARLRTRIVHFSRPTRFGPKYRDELASAPTLKVVLGANVLRFRASLGPDVGRVRHAEVRLEDGGDVTVIAQRFVLACGGVENARLLLLSDRDAPRGLGNDHDAVGRYFADQPHCPRAGEAVLPGLPGGAVGADLYLRKERDDHVSRVRTRGVFVLDPELQRAERLLGASVLFTPRERAARGKTRGVADLAKVMARTAGVDVTAEPLRVSVSVQAEQAPNPDSRVTLMEETDRLGLRRAKLDWRASDEDARSIHRTLQLMAHDLGATWAGRAQIEFQLEDPWSRTRGGSFHLGTTRMSVDPRHGVVDADCRVHGLDNLWIAGSSVFPTTSCAPPTLTVVALALRLANQLRR